MQDLTTLGAAVPTSSHDDADCEQCPEDRFRDLHVVAQPRAAHPAQAGVERISSSSHWTAVMLLLGFRMCPGVDKEKGPHPHLADLRVQQTILLWILWGLNWIVHLAFPCGGWSVAQRGGCGPYAREVSLDTADFAVQVVQS